MTKRVKLTEKQIRKTINEISYGTVDDANSINHNLFWHLQNGNSDNDFSDGFDNFYRKLEELEEILGYVFPNIKNSSNPKLHKISSLLYKISNGLNEIKNYSDEINKILVLKEKQRSNFDNAIYKYDDKNSNTDFETWDDYRKGEINNI